MKFREVIENMATINDLKRSASVWVNDYRHFDNNELKDNILKSMPQYKNIDNVKKQLDECIYHKNRNVRTLHKIILKQILLNKDDFKMNSRDINLEIDRIEQNIVNQSNNFELKKTNSRNYEMELFKFILDEAWKSEGLVSLDEKNLIVKIQMKLGISDNEYRVLEAKIGKFPKDGNKRHSTDEIEQVKKEMQKLGLLFMIKSESKINQIIIPEEIVQTLREIYEVEMKVGRYKELLQYKAVRNKQYLKHALTLKGIKFSNTSNLGELQELVLNNVKPSILIGGFSNKDGLDNKQVSSWLRDLGQNVSGTKETKMQRLIDYYDSFKEKVDEPEDERKLLFNHFELLAERNYEELRKNHIISKDRNIENQFEKATDYIFEVLLNHKPQELVGSEHPDGILSFNNKLIMWDNKSKETPVKLKDHLDQFKRYISKSKKEVEFFMVIGPDFTEDSIVEARRFSFSNNTMITLVRAADLKKLASDWSNSKKGESFPIRFFQQSGLFKYKKGLI